MKKIIITLFALALTLGSCKKDEKIKSSSRGSSLGNGGSGGSGGGNQNVLQNLTDKNWNLSYVEVYPEVDFGNGLTNDAYSSQSCIHDDYIKFKSDNDYLYNQQNTLCDPADNPVINGYWSLNSTETVITVNAGSGMTNYNLENINSTTLLLKEVAVVQGTTYTFYYTYNA